MGRLNGRFVHGYAALHEGFAGEKNRFAAVTEMFPVNSTITSVGGVHYSAAFVTGWADHF